MNVLKDQVFEFVTAYRYAVLSGMVLAGLFLRARRFTKKGLFLWDEAAYFREAYTGWLIVDFMRRHWRELAGPAHRDNQLRATLAAEYWNMKFANYVYYKPWLLYLSMAGVKLFRRRDVGAAAPALVLGTAAVAGVYFAGAAVFSAPVGLLAAALLAVSGLHVLHSRTAGAEIGVALCYTLLLLFSAWGKGAEGALSGPAAAAACGVCLAGVMMFNPPWVALMPGLFVAGEVVYAAMAGAWAAGAVFAAIALAAAAVAVLVTDIPFFIIWRLLPESEITPHCFKLVETIKHLWNGLRDRLSDDTDMGVELPRWFRFTFYPGVLRSTEGVAAPLLAVAGAVLLFAQPAPLNLWLATHAVIIAGFLTFVPQKAARACVFVLPLLALLAAVALAALPLWAGAPLAVWCLARGAAFAWKVGGLTSGVRKAADFIHAQGQQDFACTSTPFMLVYADVFPTFPKNYELMFNMWHSDKLRYLVVDHHIHYPTMLWDETVDLLEKYFEPVFTAEDPCVTFYPLLAEVEYYSPASVFRGDIVEVARWNKFRLNPSPQDGRVRVYDLFEFFKNPEKEPGLAGRLRLIWAKKLIDEARYKEAQLMLRKAKSEAPGEPMIEYYLGVCHARTDRPEWAYRIFKKLVDSDTLSKQYRELSLSFVLIEDGLRLMEKKDYAAARPLFEEAVSYTPDHLAARAYLATCCARTGEQARARELIADLRNRDLSPDLQHLCDIISEEIHGDGAE